MPELHTPPAPGRAPSTPPLAPEPLRREGLPLWFTGLGPLVLLAALIAPRPAAAQSTLGTIRGAITDTQGAAVPGDKRRQHMIVRLARALRPGGEDIGFLRVVEAARQRHLAVLRIVGVHLQHVIQRHRRRRHVAVHPRDDRLRPDRRRGSVRMNDLLQVFIARGDLAHVALFLWAASATTLLYLLLRALSTTIGRLDDFVREIARFNERNGGR